MSIYTDIKYATSDAVCAALTPFSPEAFVKYCPRFIDGFFVTAELLFLSCLIGFFLALAVAFGYSYLFRGTPLLVQLWILYFGFGSLGGRGLGGFMAVFQRRLERWPAGSDFEHRRLRF